MKRLIILVLFLMLAHSAQCPQTLALSPEPSATNLEDLYNRIKKDLEAESEKLKGMARRKYNIDLDELKESRGQVSPEIEDLFKRYEMCGNALQEIEDVYRRGIPAVDKEKILVEKSNSLVKQGVLAPAAEGKREHRGVIGALGRLDEVLKKTAPPAAREEPLEKKKPEEKQAVGERTGVEELKPKSRKLKVKSVYDPDYDPSSLGRVIEVGGEWVPEKEGGEKKKADGDYKPPDSEEWKPLDEGTELPEGTKIYTGSKGRTLITDEEGNTYVIPPLTEVEVGTEEFSGYKAKKGDLKIESGPGRPVKPKERTFESDGDIVPPNPEASPQG